MFALKTFGKSRYRLVDVIRFVSIIYDDVSGFWFLATAVSLRHSLALRSKVAHVEGRDERLVAGRQSPENQKPAAVADLIQHFDEIKKHL